MKKLLIATVIAASAFTATASANSMVGKWNNNNTNDFAFVVMKDGKGAWFEEDKVMLMEGMVKSWDCESGTVTHKIDGKLVTLSRWYYKAMDTCYYEPKSEKGQQYVKGLFSEKTMVDWDGDNISAKGYTQAVANIGQVVEVL